jgi:hypothetical protein
MLECVRIGDDADGVLEGNIGVDLVALLQMA